MFFGSLNFGGVFCFVLFLGNIFRENSENNLTSFLIVFLKLRNFFLMCAIYHTQKRAYQYTLEGSKVSKAIF